MRVAFLGTPEFAVPSLHALASRHQVVAVFTQPDRPKGRGNVLTESAVKAAAKSLRLPVVQPERIRKPEAVNIMRGVHADIGVVVGYGQIIPQNVIDVPRYGILNVHASLLPKYRGAAPIQWSIANGEMITGVTIMRIDAGLDTGDILMQRSTRVGPDETAPELSARLAPLGADLLLLAIDHIAAGTAFPQKQVHEEATFAPALDRDDGLIHWEFPAQKIYNRLRGFTPWPGAHTTFRDESMAVTRAAPAPGESLAIGEMLWRDRKLLVGAGENTTLEILEVQLPGKKRMPAQAFANGYRPLPGEKLGDQG